MGMYDRPYPDWTRHIVERLEIEVEYLQPGGPLLPEEIAELASPTAKRLDALERQIEESPDVPYTDPVALAWPPPPPDASAGAGPFPSRDEPNPPTLDGPNAAYSAGPPAHEGLRTPLAARPFHAPDGLKPPPVLSSGHGGAGLTSPSDSDVRWCPREEGFVDCTECQDCDDASEDLWAECGWACEYESQNEEAAS